MTRVAYRACALLLATLTALAAAPGCGKGEKKEAPNYFAPDPRPPKLDLSDVIPVESPDVVTAEPDSWAGKVKELVAMAETDLQRCRNEFLIPFQFAAMKRRDLLIQGTMDEVCQTGSKELKTRGPRKLLDLLAKEHMGKRPELDRFIVLGLEQVETYAVFSYMTKKIGAPDLDNVVDIAKSSQQRVLELAMQLDKSAADIAKWDDRQAADDDPSVAGAAVDAAAFKAHLVESYGPIVGDLAIGYERMADKSWQGYNMPKLDTIAAMQGILEKRVQQDRARLAKVSGDDKQKAEFEAFFAATDAAAKQVATCYDYYKKKPKDERPDRDPNLKKVQAAQKILAKTLTGWGWAVAK